MAWSPLDGAERLLSRLGEPSLDATLRSGPSNRSPLTRLPAYGLRSALRMPLFHHGVVVGSAAIHAHEPGAFGPREGIAFEQCMRALGPRLGAPPDAAEVAAPAEPTSAASTEAVVPPLCSQPYLPRPRRRVQRCQSPSASPCSPSSCRAWPTS